MGDIPAGVIRTLLEKGVEIPLPHTVYVGPEVEPDRISGSGVVLYPGCRICGSSTLIMDDCKLGAQGPVVLSNCQLGKGVKLGSGYFEESCFLDGASVGPGAHMRECCILEEKARAAHSVGLKHTILFPFVTLGSLINFCDCLMAGGTDEKNHSEVGSSYIHFNYTPNQDKATASLIGDVPKGVMLNQPPIFLGGQGGLVGPAKIAYGVVIGAGTIIRKDVTQEGTVMVGHPTIKSKPVHQFGAYFNVRRIVELNSLYIANLVALLNWYRHVRSQFFSASPMGEALFRGAVEKVERAINERIKRLGQVAERMEKSIKIYSADSLSKGARRLIERKREFQQNWPRLESAFREVLDISMVNKQFDVFWKRMEGVAKAVGWEYLSTIKALKAEDSDKGSTWLQGIVDTVMDRVWEVLPSFAGRGKA